MPAGYVQHMTKLGIGFGRNLHRVIEHPRYKPGTLAHAFKDWEVDGDAPMDAVERARQRIMERHDLADRANLHGPGGGQR